VAGDKAQRLARRKAAKRNSQKRGQFGSSANHKDSLTNSDGTETMDRSVSSLLVCFNRCPRAAQTAGTVMDLDRFWSLPETAKGQARYAS
jgi:hypothetical protein